MFNDGTKFNRIASKEMLTLTRAALDFIGPNDLGFTSNEVDTHSNRSAAAMIMFLALEPTYAIMLISIWISNAFLAYIEKEINGFTRRVSSRMLSNDTSYNAPLVSIIPSNGTTTVHGRSHRCRARLNLLYGR